MTPRRLINRLVDPFLPTFELTLLEEFETEHPRICLNDHLLVKHSFLDSVNPHTVYQKHLFNNERLATSCSRGSSFSNAFRSIHIRVRVRKVWSKSTFMLVTSCCSDWTLRWNLKPPWLLLEPILILILKLSLDWESRKGSICKT